MCAHYCSNYQVGPLIRFTLPVIISGLFIMVEIALSSVASVFAVFVMHLHSNWMNGTPVPHWLLKFTCLATKKRNDYKVSKKSSISNTNMQVSKQNHLFMFLYTQLCGPMH
jgi:hypothetical protein